MRNEEVWLVHDEPAGWQIKRERTLFCHGSMVGMPRKFFRSRTIGGRQPHESEESLAAKEADPGRKEKGKLRCQRLIG